MGDKAHHIQGECARQAPGCLSYSGQGKAQNVGPTESALLWNTQKLELHTTQGPLHIEQTGA